MLLNIGIVFSVYMGLKLYKKRKASSKKSVVVKPGKSLKKTTGYRRK